MPQQCHGANVVVAAPLPKVIDGRCREMNEKKKNKKAYQQGLKING